MDSTDGVLSRVLYHAPNKFNPSGLPFLIAKLQNGTVVKGEMSRPIVSDRYRFYGSMQAQKGRDEEAFCFSTYEVLIDDSVAGITQYLINHVPGLGRAKANSLVDHFGQETIKVLKTEPHRVIEAPKINESVVELIVAHFTDRNQFDPAAYARLVDLFEGFRVPKRVIEKLLKNFGASAIDIISAQPYSILLALPRMGWETVDKFALTRLGYAPEGLDRHSSAILEAMNQISFQGHTYATSIDVEGITFTLLGGRIVKNAWTLCLNEGWILSDSPDRFMLPKIAAAEEEIAKRLALLTEAALPLDVTLDRDGLGGEQIEALDRIEAEGVSILAGSPGTGKSYTMAKALGSLVKAGRTNIRVVAPTGKAAKRAAELIAKMMEIKADKDADNEIPCTTIHRALGPVPSETEPEGVQGDDAKHGRGRESFGFHHNEARPLDCSFLVIDESSMADVRLAASLLKAVNPGTRVLFVGDPNQLPSVGPGGLLRDMIDAGIPTSTLNEIQRSESAGRVVHGCHAIKDGRMPKWADRISMPADNWAHIEIDDPNEIANEIVELHAASKTFPDLLWDFQVVTPQKAKAAIGCNALNRRLSLKLNPPHDAAQQGYLDPSESVNTAFRVGDKVVRNKNGLADEMFEVVGWEDHPDWKWDDRDWTFDECTVVNGDMGVVRGIDMSGKKAFVVVAFKNPERLVRLPLGDCELSLAYAMTCHKAQGSGFPFVIVPVHNSFYWDRRTQTGIFNREWIYTAISRSERLLITVGQSSAIQAAVGRKTVHLRRTRLVELIRNEFAARGLTLAGERVLSNV